MELFIFLFIAATGIGVMSEESAQEKDARIMATQTKIIELKRETIQSQKTLKDWSQQ